MNYHDIKTEAEKMTNEEMLGLLREFSKSDYFKAVVKYTVEREKAVVDTIFSIDVDKKPGDVAKAQGIRAGLNDLTIGIIGLLENEQEEKKEKSKK